MFAPLNYGSNDEPPLNVVSLCVRTRVLVFARHIDQNVISRCMFVVFLFGLAAIKIYDENTGLRTLEM